VDEAAIKRRIEQTVRWRSKLEAAQALIGLKQKQTAIQLMLDGVRSVESGVDPRIMLEALIEISACLGAIDGSRARYLLDIAVKLAVRLKREPEQKRAKDLLAAFSPPSTQKRPTPSAEVRVPALVS
jgi:hypothetical protein